MAESNFPAATEQGRVEATTIAEPDGRAMTTTELPQFPFQTPPGLNTDPDGLRMLDAAPVGRARMGGHEVWLALSYQANRMAMSDPRFSREKALAADSPVAFPSMVGVTDVLAVMDPPKHTRLRRLMAKAFTARIVRQLEPRIQSIADGLLDDLSVHEQPADLIRLYTVRLPIIVICELLGVPARDRDMMHEWTNVFMAYDVPPERMAAAHQASAAYLTDLAAAKRADPGDDLTSALVAVHDEDGDQLTQSELLINLQTLIVAGHETTASQLANGIVALSRNPDQFDLLRSQPELARQAAEELLRWDRLIDTSVPWITTEDVDVDGHVIPAGFPVVAVPHVGNRDATVFEDPHRFDILRPNANQHLSFTHGPHFCLGAQLARAELRIGLETLLRRFPKLEIAVADADLPWREGRTVRSMKALPVRW
jgi:cytochrome P450